MRSWLLALGVVVWVWVEGCAGSGGGFLRYSSFGGAPFNVTYDARSLRLEQGGSSEAALLLSGSIHPVRGTVGQWEGALQAAVDLGLNAVQVYTFWNYHSPEEGVFRWDGNANLTRFVELAAAKDLFVVLRVGPYVCAEWSYGAIPVWLGQKPGVQFRCTNDVWQQAMQAYFSNIVPRLAPFFAQRGGPIIAVQVENELHTQDTKYVDWCGSMGRQVLQNVNSSVPLLMCNGDSSPLTINTCNGLSCTGFISENGQNGRVLKEQPAMWTEMEGGFQVWGGSPTDPISYFWGAPITKSAFEVAAWFARGGSHVNYYMFAPLLNHGTWAGASVTQAYAMDAPICPDGLPHPAKAQHLSNLHAVLAKYAPTIINSPPQLHHSFVVPWFNNKTQKFENGTQQIGFTYQLAEQAKRTSAERGTRGSESSSSSSVFSSSSSSASSSSHSSSSSFSSSSSSSSSSSFSSSSASSSSSPSSPSSTPSSSSSSSPSSSRVTFLESDATVAVLVQFEGRNYTLQPSSVLVVGPDGSVEYDTGTVVPASFHRHVSSPSPLSFSHWLEPLTSSSTSHLPSRQYSPAPDQGVANGGVGDYVVYQTQGELEGAGDVAIGATQSTAFVVVVDGQPLAFTDDHHHGGATLTLSTTLSPPPPKGTHEVWVVSENLGYDNGMTSGSTGKTKGIRESVKIGGVDLFHNTWTVRPDLAGNVYRVWDDEGAKNVTWSPTPSTRALSWMQAFFPTPPLTSSQALVFNATGLGRGHFFVNGVDLGRYWTIPRANSNPPTPTQQLYPIPTDVLHPTKSNQQNRIVVIEVLGATNPNLPAIQTISLQKGSPSPPPGGYASQIVDCKL